MNELTKALLSAKEGKTLYQNFLSAIDDFGMRDLLSGGVLIGLSGGADSVALLLLLLEYRRTCPFSIKAVHINHSIRGKEADLDEHFSKILCEKLNVDFEAYTVNVPAIAKSERIGLEEAARNARYKKFDEIVYANPQLSVIAVAHNATDNLETVIFNMMRGSGLVGMCGIRPVRDNIVRPLIYCSKELINRALVSAGVEFVVDSTNLSTEYTRNYIRNEIIPKLNNISTSPERMTTRLTLSLREDNDFLLSIAEKFILENVRDGIVSIKDLCNLEKPVFYRVLMLMCKKSTLPSPQKVHIDTIFSKLGSGDFSVSLPGGIDFIVSGEKAYLGNLKRENNNFCFQIKEGVNKFTEFESIILLSKDKSYDCFSNIYKKSIQAKIKFDIINNSLYIRSKEDGDSYRFGNMTRKLKKLFNDRKIPLSERENIPIFCDLSGIIWVPGFPVRDGLADGQDWYITLFNPILREKESRFFLIANN